MVNGPLMVANHRAGCWRLHHIRGPMGMGLPTYTHGSEFTMGMRINSSSSTGSTQSVGMANWQQKQQSFQNLFSSLQSGDLGSAQTALKSLTGGSGTVNSSSPLASIAQALQSGDLAGAQKAAQDFQAKRSGHHHHGGQTQASAASAPVQTSSGSGSLLNVTA